MGRQRVEPGPGQESVWDYPRPPRMEDVEEKVKIVFDGVTLVYTKRAKRVLETSHPPVYYVPPEDIRMEHLRTSGGTSYCEWKGRYRVGLVGKNSGTRISRADLAEFMLDQITDDAHLRRMPVVSY